MPGTPDTRRPRSGETWAAPWMSWTRAAAATVVNVQESFAAMSETSVASTVTVQSSPRAKSTAGSSVYVVGPPLAVAVWSPLTSHEIVNQSPATVAGWLNVTVTFAPTGTSTVPPAGERSAITVGTPPHVWTGDAVFRGAGAAATKSAALLSVSWQPEPPRTAAVVLDSAGAGAPSKNSAFP